MEMFKSDMSVPEISSSVTIASAKNNPLRIAFKETTNEVNLESLFNSNLFLNESVLNSFNFGGLWGPGPYGALGRGGRDSSRSRASQVLSPCGPSSCPPKREQRAGLVRWLAVKYCAGRASMAPLMLLHLFVTLAAELMLLCCFVAL